MKIGYKFPVMKKNTKLFGKWVVTTEGDVEGRSTKQLGTHEGYVDDIALALADHCYYTLDFTLAKGLDREPPKRTETNVRIHNLGVDNNNVGVMQGLFDEAGRNVKVTGCNYYNSFTIEPKNIEEIKRKKALAKLTKEEREILGL